MTHSVARREESGSQADTALAAALTEAIPHATADGPLRGRRVLIIVENLPCPFDRRVWQEARTLARGRLCACRSSARKGKGYEKGFEEIDGIAIYRHRHAVRGSGRARLRSRNTAGRCSRSSRCRCACWCERGFDAIHACNPPDTIFLIGGFYKLFGKKFLFDHHDINPELYEAKFGRRDLFYRLMLLRSSADLPHRRRVRSRPTSPTAASRSSAASDRPSACSWCAAGPDLRAPAHAAADARAQERAALPRRLRGRDGPAGRHRPAARRRAAHRARAADAPISSSAWSAAAPS